MPKFRAIRPSVREKNANTHTDRNTETQTETQIHLNFIKIDTGVVKNVPNTSKRLIFALCIHVFSFKAITHFKSEAQVMLFF